MLRYCVFWFSCFVSDICIYISCCLVIFVLYCIMFYIFLLFYFPYLVSCFIFWTSKVYCISIACFLYSYQFYLYLLIGPRWPSG